MSKLTSTQLHMALREIGATRMTVDYNGSGDSLGHIEFYAHIPVEHVLAQPGSKEKREAYLAERNRIKTASAIVGYNMVIDRTDAAKAKAGMLAAPIEAGCFVADMTTHLQYDHNELYELFAAVFEGNRAPFDFNNDGSAGEFEWDLITNKTRLTAGYFETVRNDSEFEDLFGTASDEAED